MTDEQQLERERQIRMIVEDCPWVDPNDVRFLFAQLDTARQQLADAESFKINYAHATKLDREAADQRETGLRQQLAEMTNQRDIWLTIAGNGVRLIGAAEKREERLRAALKPFADVERLWMNEGKRAEIRMDWLTVARELIYPDAALADGAPSPSHKFWQAQESLKQVAEEQQLVIHLVGALETLGNWPASYPANDNIQRMREFAKAALADGAQEPTK